MRICIVEHESDICKTMLKTLEGFAECESLAKARDTVVVFKEAWADWAPFDLLALDISKSEAEGIDILHEIRQLEESWNIPPKKRTKILVISSRADKETVMKCIQAGCDSYIVKPFDEPLLIQKFRSMGIIPNASKTPVSPAGNGLGGKKASMAEEISTRFRRGDINLPPFSRIAFKFNELVRLGSSVDKMVILLKQDAAIASKLISVSNTPIYRGVEKNTSLGQAVSRLGMRVTQQYVTAISNRTLYLNAERKYSDLLEKMWKHSLSCACATELVGGLQGDKATEKNFLVGLFHDIGKLLLLQVVSELEKEGRFEEELNSPKIRQIFSRFHTDFGAALLKKWGFPEEYLKVARYHHKPEAAGPDIERVKLVHGSNFLVKTLGYDLAEWTPFLPEDKEIERILMLEFGTLPDIKEKVKMRMDSLENVLS